MPKYSERSLTNLDTAHEDLQVVFKEVINYFDCTIIEGHRSESRQKELYKKGRQFNGDTGQYEIVDRSAVVTYVDGTYKKGDHNYQPSRAVDSVPYPIDWNDTDRMYFFAGFVLGVARKLKQEGKITHEIRNGADWDADFILKDHNFVDLLHFYIVKKN